MGKKRWTSEQIGDQTGRVAIVTGGNSGIGYETAKALAEKGATVVIASRSEERGAAAVERLRSEHSAAKVELSLLDLASQASVRDFAGRFLDEHDRLDLLVNNAGVMNPPERRETVDGFELQMGTNHLGHFTLTLLLLDLLNRTEGSRVVTVSSMVQNFGELDLADLQWENRPFKGMASYASSKVANMLFTLELQRRLEEAGSPTIATAAHPGWTATNLQATSTWFKFLNPFMGMPPWQGALPTLYAAVSDDAAPGGYYGPNGFRTIRGYPAPTAPAEVSADPQLAKELWSVSEELVGLRWDEAMGGGR